MLPDTLRQKISYELNLINRENEVVSLLKKKQSNADLDDIELRALASSLHAIYNGIEKILIFILNNQGTKPDSPGSWHSKLLKSAMIEGIISVELENRLRDLMGFRHFFRHAYGFMLDKELLLPLLEGMDMLLEDLKSEIL